MGICINKVFNLLNNFLFIFKLREDEFCEICDKMFLLNNFLLLVYFYLVFLEF